MRRIVRYLSFVLGAGLVIMTACTKDNIVPVSEPSDRQEEQPGGQEGGDDGGEDDNGKDTPVSPTPGSEDGAQRIIPADLKSLPKVYINTPRAVSSKHTWVEAATIRIVGDGDAVLLEQDSLQIRGRGNSTWTYPKKPYYIKFKKQEDLYGTGKSRRWVLLANWMDRTLLRNVVAFEAARRTSLEWTPDGGFVELYLNGRHLGNYWFGEKINVEGSKFRADFLFTMDTSDGSIVTGIGEDGPDFLTEYGFRPNSGLTGLPVEVKYPDRDDYPVEEYEGIIRQAKAYFAGLETDLCQKGDLSVIDIDSFCDWYLVHELCYNLEPNHPKSCFFHLRDGKLIAGPVWDFDWYTFTPGHRYLDIRNSIYFSTLMSQDAFVRRLRERWADLKPEFLTLGSFIDTQADLIRSSEAVNHSMWPIQSSTTNGDERISFQDAVDRMKTVLTARIAAMDSEISKL